MHRNNLINILRTNYDFVGRSHENQKYTLQHRETKFLCKKNSNGSNRIIILLAVALGLFFNTALASTSTKNIPPVPAPDTAPISLPFDNGKVTVFPDKPFTPINIEYKGNLVRPVMMGPNILTGKKQLGPGQYHLKLFRSSFDKDANKVHLVYSIDEFKKPTYYWLTISTDGSFIKIDFELRAPVVISISPGFLFERIKYKPFTMTPRVRESWEQNSMPAAFWHKKAKLWVYAQWSLDHSNSTALGSGTNWGKSLSSTPQYGIYAGKYRRPLKEQLKIGVSNDLWKAVGKPANLPSEYANEMKDMMFIDLWGGNNQQKEAFVKSLCEKVRGTVKFYTIVQTWQAGGFDVYNPDAYWPKTLLPDEKKYGSIKSLQSLVNTASKYGRAGLRTNYFFINKSPSAKAGLIKGRTMKAAPESGALMSDEHQSFRQSSMRDWWRLARFQESDIHRTFKTSGLFVDQVSSMGGAGFMQDMTPYNVGTGIARYNSDAVKKFCRKIKEIHKGPLSSETLNGEHLIGYWVDTGDYGIFNGANRLVSPEYKLNRLHHLSVFHGMGLAYRFFAYPQQFKRSGDWLGSGHAKYYGLGKDFYASADKYRAMAVLFGNGAYYYAYPTFKPAKRAHDEQAFTEAMTIGVLQHYYALQPVKTTEYFWENKWQTLNELMDSDKIHFKPNKDDCPAFKTIRINYANGLKVVVNRDDKPITVTAAGQKITLNKDAWAGYKNDGSVLVYSGMGPLAKKRIDYTFDKKRKILFINPRSQNISDHKVPTLFIKNEIPTKLLPSK